VKQLRIPLSKGFLLSMVIPIDATY